MPIARVQLPDGRIARFEVPEGTTPEQVMAFAQENLPQQAPAPQIHFPPGASEAEKQAVMQEINGTAPSVGTQLAHAGLTVGRGLLDSATETAGAIPDLVAAGLRGIGATALAPANPDFYTDALKSAERKAGSYLQGLIPQDVKAPTELDKELYGFGRGAGSAASVFVPAKLAADIAPAGSRIKLAADMLKAQPVAQVAAGGTAGAVTEATDNPYLGFAASLGVAGAAGAGKQALLNLLERRATAKAAPATQALAAQGSRLFTDALGNPAKVSSQAYDNLLADMKETLRAERAKPNLHPKVVAVYDSLLDDAGSAPTFHDLQAARRQIGIALRSNEPDEQRIAKILEDKLDDFVENLTPADMASGQVGASATELRAARGLWRRMKKSQLIEDAIENGRLAASGEDNGIRDAFRRLRKNKKAMRGFSADEKAAIQEVADGKFTRNSLRRLGKMSFGAGVQANILNGLAGSAVGFASGNPWLGVAVPVAAYGFQKAAQAGTQNAAEYARALAALGGRAAPGRVARVLGPANPKGLLASTLLGQANTPAGEQVLRGLLAR